MDIWSLQTASVCTCDHFAPTKRQLTTPVFLASLAQFYADLGLPASQTVNWALDELYQHSSGTLHDLDDKPIDLFSTVTDAKGDVIDVVEWAFGADFARSMRRIMERATKTYRNQMKMTPQIVTRVLLLHYARQIHICRTLGTCSKR